MEARTEYEKMILMEVREMPDEVLPQVVKVIHSLKEGCAFCESASQGSVKPKGAVSMAFGRKSARWQRQLRISTCEGRDSAVER